MVIAFFLFQKKKKGKGKMILKEVRSLVIVIYQRWRLRAMVTFAGAPTC